MGLWVPSGSGEFSWRADNYSTTRPATTWGTTVTFTGNTGSVANPQWGTWTQVLSGGTVSTDVFGLWLNFHDPGVPGNNQVVAAVGVDPAGGSSYTTLITDLIFQNPSLLANGGGTSYYFPIWIKAGSSIAVRGYVDSSGTMDIAVMAAVYGKPTDPASVKVGTYVTAFGVTYDTWPASGIFGVAITSGTTSEGSWTSLASSIARDHWWWQTSFLLNDATMTAGNIYNTDLAFGDASNKIIIIQDEPMRVEVNGSPTKGSWPVACERNVKAGNNLYGRIQCSGTADSNLAMVCYGVGG